MLNVRPSFKACTWQPNSCPLKLKYSSPSDKRISCSIRWPMDIFWTKCLLIRQAPLTRVRPSFVWQSPGHEQKNVPQKDIFQACSRIKNYLALRKGQLHILECICDSISLPPKQNKNILISFSAWREPFHQLEHGNAPVYCLTDSKGKNARFQMSWRK